MARLIDADLLLEKMNKYAEDDWNKSLGLHVINTVSDCMDMVDDMQTVNQWIPVSERLPDDTMQNYLCQTKCGLIDILGFTKDAYHLDKYDFAEYKKKKKALFYEFDSEYGYFEKNVIAWMPLPEKYQQ